MPILTLSSEQANAHRKSNPNSRWPDGRRSTDGRLGFYATVGLNPSFQFREKEPIFTIGSCFAREIEKQLLQLGFEVPMAHLYIPPEERASDSPNDILNKYVPQAMANELRWVLDPAFVFPEQALLQVADDLWHDPHLAANIMPATLERVKERRKQVIDMYQSVRQCRIIIITLGLVEAWYDTQTGLYLNGTPPGAAFKRYRNRFEMHLLSYEEIMASLADIYQLLKIHGHPDFKILLTVSPVPFKATFTQNDAMVANCYSKSVLRAAAEVFVRQHENVDYFPSYETVTMGERSLNYEADNIHVRREVVANIMNQVVRHYMPGVDATAKPSESEAQAVAAAAAKPTDANPVSLYGYARALAKSEDYLTASNTMRNILENFGVDRCGITPATFHLDFGGWLVRAKMPKEAIEQLQIAIKLEPGNPRSHYKLGIALERLKRREEGLASFRTAYDLAPDTAYYNWRLAHALLASGQAREALPLAQRALELDPEMEDAQLTLDRITAKIKSKIKEPT